MQSETTPQWQLWSLLLNEPAVFSAGWHWGVVRKLKMCRQRASCDISGVQDVPSLQYKRHASLAFWGLVSWAHRISVTGTFLPSGLIRRFSWILLLADIPICLRWLFQGQSWQSPSWRRTQSRRHGAHSAPPACSLSNGDFNNMMLIEINPYYELNSPMKFGPDTLTQIKK
jgi:hypothetical protein